jgi:hypothetical protein
LTVAVIVNTDPLAALAGFTDSVVVVAVCAPATAEDITTINATHKKAREFFRREVLPRVFALLEILNVLSEWPEICGSAIASEQNAVRRRDCEGTHLKAMRKNRRRLHVVLADEADRQKRSEDESPRKTFIIAGISEPFD